VLYFAEKARERPVSLAVEVGIPHFFCCQDTVTNEVETHARRSVATSQYLLGGVK